MRIISTRLTLTMLLTAALALPTGCSDDEGGSDGGDSGVRDTGTSTTADGGSGDTGVDTGPTRCWRDQQCDTGEVCDVLTGECGTGAECQTDNDCLDCSNTLNPRDCGHGVPVIATCEANICRRGLGNCEPCTTDDECSPLPSVLGGQPGKCLDYGNGEKFCGRSTRNNTCPPGFIDNGEGFCQAPLGCPDDIAVCPEKELGGNQACLGTSQLCEGEPCPTGGRCTGNDLPGTVGVCVDFCSSDADCPATLPFCNRSAGVCTPGCSKDGCAAGEVCHLDGKCGAACDSDTNCEQRFSEDYGDVYCHVPGGIAPRYDKGGMNGYRDYDSCAPLGCERNFECGAVGYVCDSEKVPTPLCVEGCFEDDDCSSEEICRSAGPNGPQQSYTRAECRALDPVNMSNGEVGVCCNPGCRDRVLQCPSQFDYRTGWWCCAESGSPFEDPGSCGPVEDPNTGAVRTAEAGECFLAEPPTWCTPCESNDDCNSGWTPGFNDIQGNGTLAQEQEFCSTIADGVAICAVTCNPGATDNGCPRGWACSPIYPPCLQDADCGGLECINEDTTVDPPRYGQCKCGDSANGEFAMCPGTYANFPAVSNPRCVEQGTNMVCVAAYNCNPPFVQQDMQTMEYNYSQVCIDVLTGG